MIWRKKRLLRMEITSIIKRFSKSEIQTFSERVVKNILELQQFKKSPCVLGYYPLPDEVDVRPVLELVLESDGRLCLPRITDRARGLMQAVEISSLDGLQKRSMQIMEPVDGRPVNDLSCLDLVLVPGRAFDKHGHRVGRGGGYYDRLFATLPESTLKAGIAFGFQVVNEVPREDWDAKVDLLITEDGITQVS